MRRFAERARAQRRLSLRNTLWLAGSVVILLLAGWVVLLSPLLAVRTVEVSGTQRVPTPLVVDVADATRGVPLARVDVSEVSRDVRSLTGVRTATVERSWPSTLRIEVVERVPLAAIPTPEGFQLVDGDGVVLETVPEPPPGVPRVDVDIATAGSRTVQEVAAVLKALPAELRGQVSAAGATSRDSVTLKLANGATVVWGSADESDRKVQILHALLTTEAKVYDVSAPDLPVTR